MTVYTGDETSGTMNVDTPRAFPSGSGVNGLKQIKFCNKNCLNQLKVTIDPAIKSMITTEYNLLT